MKEVAGEGVRGAWKATPEEVHVKASLITMWGDDWMGLETEKERLD